MTQYFWQYSVFQCRHRAQTPVCAGESHLKQNSGVAERFEFIHPHWKRLVCSLLFEQSLKRRRKRAPDQSLRSGFDYFDDPSQRICCEPTRLKLKPQPTKHTIRPSVLNIQIWASKIFTMLPAVKLGKITLYFHKQIFKSGVIVDSVCHNMHCTLQCRGKPKLLVRGVKMVINAEYTHTKKVQKC